MASYLRPRRGKKSTAESQAIVLKRGEVFFEVPDNGVGTGAGKIKMGDGSTAYASLPYFTESLNLNGDDANVAFTNTTAATDASNNATYLTNMAPTASLKTLFTNIKQLLFNYNSQLTSLNNDFVSNIFVGDDGKLHKVQGGADSVLPFKNSTGSAGVGKVIQFMSKSANSVTKTWVADGDYKTLIIGIVGSGNIKRFTYSINNGTTIAAINSPSTSSWTSYNGDSKIISQNIKLGDKITLTLSDTGSEGYGNVIVIFSECKIDDFLLLGNSSNKITSGIIKDNYSSLLVIAHTSGNGLTLTYNIGSSSEKYIGSTGEAGSSYSSWSSVACWEKINSASSNQVITTKGTKTGSQGWSFMSAFLVK